MITGELIVSDTRAYHSLETDRRTRSSLVLCTSHEIENGLKRFGNDSPFVLRYIYSYIFIVVEFCFMRLQQWNVYYFSDEPKYGKIREIIFDKKTMSSTL